MIKKIIKIVLVILWMGVIFTFSSDNGNTSEAKSDKIIINVYKTFHKGEFTRNQQKKIISKYVFLVRKLAHLTEYLILGILIISLISEYKYINAKYILIAIILCMLYAISDEIHQLFSDGRSAEILDVLIDTIGSSIGINIYYFIKVKLLDR